MNILSNTFKGGLDQAQTYQIIIAPTKSFVEKSTGKSFSVTERWTAAVTVATNGDFTAAQVSDIPATNDADIPDLRYNVSLLQGTGRRARAIPVFFNDEEITEIVINLQPTGETTWNELKQLTLAQCGVQHLIALDYFNTAQSDARYLQQSQFDYYLDFLNPIFDGGNSGDFIEHRIDGGHI